MDPNKCTYHKLQEFKNIEGIGGIQSARMKLQSLKDLNEPFLDKHPDLIEDYNLLVGQDGVTLEYYIYNRNLYGPEEN